MAEVVAQTGITREPGYLYFVSKDGHAARSPMARRGQPSTKGKQEVVSEAGVKKEKGYLYFIDKQGNIARAKMGKKKKK